MKIIQSELEAVAASRKQYPSGDVPEIAFAGRSNVGKSTLLNLITGRKNLARVSGNPGKTRTINFYNINSGLFRIVDLPGYGYAKLSRSQTESWGRMIEEYLENRPNLLKVAQLVDCRHEPSAQDVQMYDYLKYHGLDGLVIATKADKISKGKMGGNISIIRKKLKMSADDIVIPASSLARSGDDRIRDEIEKLLEAWKG